jgi:hypothetical protein
MTSRYWRHLVLVGASFSLACTAAIASPQVVGDEPCELYEVDIASFASCVDGRVVRPESFTYVPAEMTADRLSHFIRFAPDASERSALLLAAMLLGDDAVKGNAVGTRHDTGCDAAPQPGAQTVTEFR